MRGDLVFSDEKIVREWSENNREKELSLACLATNEQYGVSRWRWLGLRCKTTTTANVAYALQGP